MLRNRVRFNPLLRPDEEDWSDLPPILRPDPPVAPPQPAWLSVPGWPPPARPRMPSIFGLELMPAPAPDAYRGGRRVSLLEMIEGLPPHRPTPPSLFGAPSPVPVPSHGMNILLGPDDKNVQALTGPSVMHHIARSPSLLDVLVTPELLDQTGPAPIASPNDAYSWHRPSVVPFSSTQGLPDQVADGSAASPVAPDVSEPGAEPRDVPEAVKRVWERYWLLGKLGRWLGLETAPEHLAHYLGATGTPLPVTRDMVRSFAPFRKAEREIEGNYERSFLESPSDRYANPEADAFSKSRTMFGDQLRALKDGESTTIQDRWDVVYDEWLSKKLPGGYTPDFYLAWGDTSLTSDGEFTATRHGDKIVIEGRAKHNVNDPYDFKSGAPYGGDAHRLESHGKAKPFERRAAWDRRLTGTIELRNGRLRNPQFTWEDID